MQTSHLNTSGDESQNVRSSGIPTAKELAQIMRNLSDAIDALRGSILDELQMPHFSVSCDSVIEMYHAEKPSLVWHVGKSVLPRLRRLKDDCGRFLMGTVERKFREPETTLLGHPIKIVEGHGLRLVTVGGNHE